jgi:hypothetical protein
VCGSKLLANLLFGGSLCWANPIALSQHYDSHMSG